MSTKFLVNGVEKTLSMIDDGSGTDMSSDFIGNTSHGMGRDDEGRYIATQEDFEWWQETIAAHQAMGELIQQYRDKHGVETVDDYLQRVHAFDVDLGDQPDSVRHALEQLDE